jgi:UDP-N-acetylglucosamine 1-carboxyvinyltransferase
MDKIRIQGGKRLQGKVTISGSKNAALPILISSLLTAEKCHYNRVPGLDDIDTTLKVLESLGAGFTRDEGKHEVMLQMRTSEPGPAAYDLVRKMRASVLVLGPLLARYGHAKVSLPGGCAIGARPIGLHLSALEKLGGEIRLEGGYVVARTDGLKGAKIVFDFPSVGATENTMMAAALAQGETVLENCAREPEIVDLARALRAMGLQIEGEGSSTIRIQGRSSLGGCRYNIMGDRIEAGTYLAAGLITGGSVRTEGISPEWLGSVLDKFEDAGAKIERGADFIALGASGRPRATELTTLPYPGFPTDMQAQLMAVFCVANGTSQVTETIFENRFMHVAELARLGADISVRGNVALVKGKDKLTAAPLMATDLRASASLILAALVAEGESIISRVYHLDRGYEAIETKLGALGATIERFA